MNHHPAHRIDTNGLGLRIMPSLIIPCNKTCMRGEHHAVPFTASHFLIVIICQFLIPFNLFFHKRIVRICHREFIFCIPVCQCCIKTHQLQIHSRNSRIIYQSVKCILGCLRNLYLQIFCLLHQFCTTLDHALRFIEMRSMVYFRIHRLRSSHAVDPCVFTQYVCDLFFRLFVFDMCAKLLLYPGCQEKVRFIGMAGSHTLEIIGKCHKIGQWQLIRTDITDIYDPEVADAVFIGHRNLFPHFRKRCGIDPLIRNRGTVIIKMIVQPPARLAVFQILSRKGSYISEVIIGEQKDRIVQAIPGTKSLHAVSTIIKPFHFFVQSKHFRHILASGLFDDLILIGNDLTKKFNIFLNCRIFSEHHRVTLTAHTDRDHMLEVFIAFHTIFPITIKAFFVCIIIPIFSISNIVHVRFDFIPLFTGAGQWLVMGLTDRDTKFRSQFQDCKRILRTI